MTQKETITIEKATLWKIVSGVLALVVIVMFLNKGGTAPLPTAPTAPAAGDEFPVVSVSMKALADDDAVIGDANAPVTIVEFSDFQCPFCQRFYTQTEAQIINTYVKTGKARFIYRDFPLSFHQNAEKAALASECAHEQGKFWEYHDILFKYSQGDGTGLNTEDLKKYASDLGLNTVQFNGCLDSEKYKSEVQKDMQDGTAVGIRGTPGFLIGKTDGSTAQTISGAYPFDAFQQVIEAALN
jgi:protein-disulfide isomerase